MKKTVKEILNIRNDFFDLDEEKKIVRITLGYRHPDEIMDENVLTRIPLTNEDFNQRLLASFDYVPRLCRLDLILLFDSLGGHTPEELDSLIRKNILLQARINDQKEKQHSRLGWLLCGTSLLLILLMTFLNARWQGEGTFREIVFYLLDIMATVPFWGAMEIFVIERKERRSAVSNLLRRFHSISIREKEG